VNLNYLYDRWNVNFGADIVGRRDDFRAASPFGTTVKGGYAIFNLASYYSLPLRVPAVKDLTLFGKIENLLNKKYEEADGFRARPLNFLLGMRATFGS
jgi:outer membrane receptor protein involved in Fe transport